MSLAILGLGTATPEHRISQVDAARLAIRFCCQTRDERRLLEALYRRSGVRARGCVVLENLSPLATRTSSPPADSPSFSIDGADWKAAAEADAAEITQSFYPDAVDAQDRGPSTSERMRLFEQHAGPLALRAAQAALDNGALAAEQITHLVTVCCTGFGAPGVDLHLIRELGLSPSVARTHIGFMGCHGAINGLRAAQAFAQSQPGSNVLLCCVELCSLHQQYGWQPDQIVSNALFADGAAAVVSSHPATVQAADWSLRDTGSMLLPETEDLMSWHVRDHGFEMTLSARVPDVIRQHLRPWLSDWLSEHSLSIAEIGSWVVHPGGPRVLLAAADGAGFDHEHLLPSQQILAEHGNMSSPTVLFILERLRQQAAALPCVMLAFGPGLTIEAALFD